MTKAMTDADELRKLADECCAFPDATEGGSLGEKVGRLAVCLSETVCPKIPAAVYVLSADALRGSWDAFVALLPDGWGWSRTPFEIGVRIPAEFPGAWFTHIIDNPQPRHGVAAILRAMADRMEREHG